ncbi:phosphoribosyltransferase, partial [bacterium]|nr:phosphoribosyltransferase [bacterium]
MNQKQSSSGKNKKNIKLRMENFLGLGKGRNENKSFWERAKEKSAIRPHVMHRKTHYYFYFDTLALTENEEEINWGVETLYPDTDAPEIILTTSNKVAIRIADYFINKPFEDAYHVRAKKNQVGIYRVPTKKKIQDKKILIVTDIANSGKSIEGLINLCLQNNTNLNQIKLYIFIDRLVADDWSKISEKLPEENIYSLYRIPIPSFKDNQAHCPLCREIEILKEFEGSQNYEFKKYVKKRLNQITEKDSKFWDDIPTDPEAMSNLISRGKTLDFLFNLGENSIVEAIANDKSASYFHHALEALPEEYDHTAKVKSWLSKQIKSTTDGLILRELIRAALIHNPQAIFDHTPHIVEIFASLKKDGFLTFVYNYLVYKNILNKNTILDKLKSNRSKYYQSR